MKMNRQVGFATAVVLSQLFSISAHAWTFTLQDGNSSADVITASDQGVNNWVVDGQNQLYQQWFWYRVGSSGGEAPISTLPVISENQSSPGTLDVKYSNGQFSIETTYSLLGGAPGSGSSDIGEQIKIVNLTGGPLDFHFFQYTDFDLGGNYAGDTVQLGKNLQNLFNEALQSKGNVHFADTVISPGANHGETGIWPSILNKLNDGSPTTLNDNAGPITGDATWAFQWDRILQAGGSLNISIDKNIYVTNPIPEPTTCSLVVMGLALTGLLRRHSRRK